MVQCNYRGPCEWWRETKGGKPKRWQQKKDLAPWGWFSRWRKGIWSHLGSL